MIGDKNIVLIGPMAAGKSTLGRALAKSMDRPFFDSDQEVILQTGVEISLIFDIEGEAGFRKRETEMLEKLMAQRPIVLATGGGAVLAGRNRQILRQDSVVVYLQCSVEQQLARTRHDTRRPLLQTENPRLKLEELMEQRGPIYESLSDIQVSTEHYSTRGVLKTLMAKLVRAE